MRILLTNDDGIMSPGIQMLMAALREAGHRVYTVAPGSDRSGISHSISFINNPCKLVEIDKDTWVCDGTPVDCIIVGLLGGIPELCILNNPDNLTEHQAPDLIISGINRGANLGTDIVYSGTASAARQGALCNIPSIAFSLQDGPVWNWEMAVIYINENLDEMISYWKPDTFINVNIPNYREFPLGLVHAFPSLRYYNDRIETYQAPDGNRYCFAKAGVIGAKPDEGSDWKTVTDKYASISEVYIHPVLLESVRGRGEAL